MLQMGVKFISFDFAVENLNTPVRSPVMKKRPDVLNFNPKQNDNLDTERKLKEIMKISGYITIDETLYITQIRDQMKDIEVLGNGTCGHVVKMLHVPSGKNIAVKVRKLLFFRF